MSDQGNIIPICIYHYIDPNTKTFKGYISPPRKIELENGKYTYECPKIPHTFGKWFLYGVFYALDPSFRPIPVGMKIFCAEKPHAYPYDTSDVYLMYDPFNIKDNCVYFTTYNMPVPNTRKLYFHKIGNGVFPSFDPEPPSNNPGWTQTDISPIFVMTPDTVGNIFDTNETLKFKCINGRCIPWNKNIPNIYQDDKNTPLLELDKCVVYCNELVVTTNSTRRPSTLLSRVAQETAIKDHVPQFFQGIGPVWIGIIVAVFCLLLFGIIIMVIRKK